MIDAGRSQNNSSIAYTLTYQSALATLSDKDVDKIHKRVIDALKQKLKAQIRGLD